MTSISEDGGHTWAEPVLRAKGFVNSNAKIWGQRLSDGTYATVYNPSEFRWPLAISLSKDGLEYTTLNLVHGEILRCAMEEITNHMVLNIPVHSGRKRSPADGDLWVSYSVNKEDMWISRIPVPVEINASAHADDDFSKSGSIAELTNWNIYSPVWAPVSLEGEWLKYKIKIPSTMRR